MLSIHRYNSAVSNIAPCSTSCSCSMLMPHRWLLLLWIFQCAVLHVLCGAWTTGGSFVPRSLLSTPVSSNGFNISVHTSSTRTRLFATVEATEQSGWIISQIASPPLLLLVSLVLGVAANGWIQRLLNGEQGLSSFLSDGSGFNKSKFKPLRSDGDRAVQSDPLPWLRLPRLDFVEVAGQESRTPDLRGNDAVVAQLEMLRARMNEQLAAGNVEEASALRQQMETVMRESNVQFLVDDR
jgi:hypothetical protein